VAPQGHHQTHHDITIAAPAPDVYRLLADAESWPAMFGPSVYVRRLAGDENSERLHMWAYTSGEVRNWVSCRRLLPSERRIRFWRESSRPPVAAMTGEWSVLELSDGATRVVLDHEFSAIDDAPDGVAWITEATHRNSVAELAALKETAELAGQPAGEPFSFEDSLVIEGDIKEVYDFLARAEAWPERIPHVARLVLREDAPGEQVMEMDTRSTDGAAHTTKSVRVCFEPALIVYKQITTPAVMRAHTGYWALTETSPGVLASAQHTVTLDADGVRERFGATTSQQQARERVRKSLGANSLATLRLAKAAVERRPL
jgi:aromatase